MKIEELQSLLEEGRLGKVEEGGKYYFVCERTQLSPELLMQLQDGAKLHFGINLAVIRYDGRANAQPPQLFRVTG